MASDPYDVAIVGAGPNGLTAAAYIARAGARVVILERRFERGGTFATDDYSTPFQYNLAQFELPLGRELPPFRDLALEEQGVGLVEPGLPFAAQLEPGGEELAIGRGGRGLGSDAESMLGAVSDAVGPMLYAPPAAGAEQELDAGGPGAAGALASISPAQLAGSVEDPRAGVILRYACAMAGFLDGDAPLGAIGAYAVARLFSPTLVVGGTKNLANGLFRSGAAAGARSLVDTEVVAVGGEPGAFQLRAADGRDFAARAVVSTLDPRSTFHEVLDEALVPDELQAAASEWEIEPTGPFTAHYGVKGDPPDPATDDADALVRIFGFAGPADVEERCREAATGQLRPRPAGHLSVVSMHDPLQASPGPFGPLHALRTQAMAPFQHPDGGWDAHRVAYREALWEELLRHFPSLGSATALFQFCDTPLDMERRFRTTRRGSIRHGALTPEQTFARRPHPTCSAGRTPMDGVYLGGGSVHPGIPGSLGGGYNVAAAVTEDLALERWWPRAAAGRLA